ncbi:MAG TPA: tetratricopeptide repeat protein, partial [Thermoanaerobaculia bacterium]|nr:tetratricopeptide repeat protein [Thermoanaerobaculia bacterium]
HLLSIAKNLPRFDPFRAVTLAMSRRSQLEGRLLSILQADVRRRAFSARGVAIACGLALLVVIPISAFRMSASPAPEQQAQSREPKNKDFVYAKNDNKHKKTDSEITVVPDVESLTDYFFTNVVKLERTPKNGHDWYERGMELHHQDRYDEAIEAFKHSIAAGYRIDASKYNIACGYSLLDDKENALRWLNEAVDAGFNDPDKIGEDSDLDPIRSDPRFRQIIGNEAADQVTERVTETLQDYDRLRKEHAKDGDDWYENGLDLLRLRKFDESIAAFQEAIRLNGKPASAMYNIACAYSLSGNRTAAIEWLDKAVQNGFDQLDKLKNDPDIRAIRDDARVRELTQMANDLRLQPQHDKWSWFHGDDDWEEVAQEHRRMTQKYPNQGRAWFNLGYSSLQAENYKESIDSFQRALQLNYRPGTSSYNIACAYARQDNKDAAFEWLKKARATGFELCNYLEDDEDLDNLHRDPRYRALRESLRAEMEKEHEDD